MSGRKTNKKRWIARSRGLRELVDHCVVCFSTKKLHVHHIRYRKGGRGSIDEQPEDLVVLCEECHNSLHRQDYKGVSGFLEFREARRRFLDDLVMLPAWLRGR